MDGRSRARAPVGRSPGSARLAGWVVLRIGFVAFLGLAGAACTGDAPSEGPPPAARPAGAGSAAGAPAPAGSTVLTILHTNDWHGYAFSAPDRITGVEGGGAVAIRAAIERVRRERPGAVLVLDAGDLLSGHPAVSFVDDGVKGLAFCRLWDQIGFDAWAIGNHELDHGRPNLAALVAALRSPALCANWLAAPSGQTPAALGAPSAVGAKPWLVVERAGLKVGIVGVVTGGLRTLASKETLAGTALIHPVDALKAIVPVMEAETDLQLALTHVGVEVDERIAAEVPGLDAVIGGHSHTFLAEPKVVNGIPIVQAGQHGRVLGRLDLTVAGGAVTGFRASLVAAPRAGAEALVPPALVAAEAALRARVDALEAEVVGAWPRASGRAYFGQSDLGGAVAESFRVAVEADLGIVNSGGVRADLNEGPVTRKELMEILPFDNHMVVIRLTGEQLSRMIHYNARATATEAHGVLNFAGVVCRWRRAGARDVEVVEATVRGKPIDPARTYACATSDYLLEQRAKYLGIDFADSAVEHLDLLVRDAFERGLRQGAIQGGPYGVNADVAAPVGAGAGAGG